VADWEREQESCGKCGRARSECSDPATVWYPQRTICYADMAASQVRWKYEQLHGPESQEQFHDGSFEVWAPRRSDAFPFGAEDGVGFWVSTEDLSPLDNFLGDAGAMASDE
jgi:hypothetical protein